MALSRATVLGKITSAMFNAVVDLLEPVPYTIGWKPVTPSSVAGGGVTVASKGRVSFAASTAVNINGIFTSTYTHYRIEIYAPTTSASLNYTIVLRVAGVDATAANYDSQTLQASSATVIAAQSLAAASWGASAATSSLHKTTIDLSNPGVAAPTLGMVTALSLTNPMTAAAAIIQRGILHRLSTAYDGITISFSGGNATGTVRVYGWNENV